MIVGIGTDIVKCERIAAAYRRHGERFVCKLLCDEERVAFAGAALPVAFLAKRFAAKEAAAKALGVGIGGRAPLHGMVVRNNEDGAPSLVFSGAAAATARDHGVVRVHLSLADEDDCALAFVVLEGV